MLLGDALYPTYFLPANGSGTPTHLQTHGADLDGPATTRADPLDGLSIHALLVLIAESRVGLRHGRVEPRALQRRQETVSSSDPTEARGAGGDSEEWSPGKAMPIEMPTYDI